MPLHNIFSETFETIWQSALVKLPRAVPTAVLKYTSPDGPQPYILDLPSRDFGLHTTKHGSKRTIPCYVFLPPVASLAQTPPDNNASPPDARPTVSLPVLVDFHGGGFFMGSCLEQAPFCALMARSLNAVVISVDYRMAPIDKFPAAVHDAEDVLRCLLDPAAPGARELAKSVELRCADAFRLAAKSAGRRSRAGSKSSRTSREASPVKPSSSSVASVASSRNPSPKKSGRTSRNPSPKKRGRTSRNASPTAPTPLVTLDRTRIAISGFSSGGNIALNAVTNVPAGSPHIAPGAAGWPCAFPADAPHAIPVLLYYPALDLRQLPSERKRPDGLPTGSPFWARLSDNLAPSYVPRDLADHWRASPGLADARRDIHPAARMMLVLPELDNLADQSERWVEKVARDGRAEDLLVERYATMKHGWTQFPDGWLDAEQRRTRDDIFEKTVDFIRKGWFDGRREV